MLTPLRLRTAVFLFFSPQSYKVWLKPFALKSKSEIIKNKNPVFFSLLFRDFFFFKCPKSGSGLLFVSWLFLSIFDGQSEMTYEPGGSMYFNQSIEQ